jgi:hypothetical protein
MVGSVLLIVFVFLFSFVCFVQDRVPIVARVSSLLTREIKIAVYHIYIIFQVDSQYQVNSVLPTQLFLTLHMIKSCFLLFFYLGGGVVIVGRIALN